MPMAPIPAVTLTPVAHFPENYFLENLVVRADGSVLITTVLQKELWYVPSTKPGMEFNPILLHTFKHPILGIRSRNVMHGNFQPSAMLTRLFTA